MSGPGPLTREWRPDWPCRPAEITAPHRRGAGDPSYRLEPDGSLWRASTTPDGIGLLHVRRLPALGVIELTAWGAGAGWLLDAAPGWLGADDDVSDFRPTDPRVAAAWRRNPNWRVTRSGLVFESLAPAIIEQKVTGQEAFRGWQRLLRRYGTVAPGPGAELGMRALPSATEVAGLASWDLLRCGIDPKRTETLVRAAVRAPALERTLDRDPDDADRVLRAIRGIGVWTSAEVRQRAHGHPDAVSFGDYHIAGHIGYALTGARFDDQALAELLEPERPHRYRVQHIVTTRMPGPPRHGPRMAPRPHLPTR